MPACLLILNITIGVFGLFRPAELTVQPQPGSVLLLDGTPVRSPAHISVRKLEAEQRLTFTARDGGPAEFLLSVPGKIKRRFRGTLSIKKSDGALIPVITLDLETAAAAAVAAEMPASSNQEALKALAVLARSYYARGGRHRNFDFCDTTHCQFHREPPGPDHPAYEAALHTAGLVLLYRGRPFRPLYSASCGGRTRTAVETGLRPDDYPYFAVECRECLRNTPTAREGHGTGLCQRGANAMAAAGSDFVSILQHYFPNTRPSRALRHE